MQVVCECIVVMKGIKEVSWKSAKGMMSEANFLKSLTDMDVDGISTKQVSTVKGMFIQLSVGEKDQFETENWQIDKRRTCQIYHLISLFAVGFLKELDMTIDEMKE